jgi:hypothetical protein
VTGRGFAHLAGLPKLRWVSLAHSQVNDDGMREIAMLQNVTELDLRQTRITDAGLTPLHTAAGEHLSLKLTTGQTSEGAWWDLATARRTITIWRSAPGSNSSQNWDKPSLRP